MTDPLGKIQTFAYNFYGNMTESTDRNGNKIRYTFDYQNRKTNESWKNSAGQAVGDEFTWSYYAAGNVASTSYNSTSQGYSNSLSAAYDVLVRTDSVVSFDSARSEFKMSFDYDLNGNRTLFNVGRANPSWPVLIGSDGPGDPSTPKV
jgi:YD repeat-containing protein